MKENRILEQLHKECVKMGYKQLAGILGVSLPAAHQKISKKQYTIKDLDLVFNGLCILKRQE